jgi:hypothetical protein
LSPAIALLIAPLLTDISERCLKFKVCALAKHKPKSERRNSFVFKGVEVWVEKYV